MAWSLDPGLKDLGFGLGIQGLEREAYVWGWGSEITSWMSCGAHGMDGFDMVVSVNRGLKPQTLTRS